jgi:hypothetical protein
VRTNRETLKVWIDDQKKVNPNIVSDLMKYVRISVSSWKRLIYEKGYCPNPQTRILLAQFTGLDENLLFPVVDSSEGEVA